MAYLTLRPLLRAGLPHELLLSCTMVSTGREFSVLNRPPPNYPGHIPLTKIEKFGLAIGSAIGSLINPRRGDLIAALGEATATPYFISHLHKTMLSDPTGRRILRLRPRITSTTLSIPRLSSLSPNTLGHAYATWLSTEHVSPDTRAPVTYIDNEEEAYVMQRYRECHDFYHAITGMPVIVEGETIVKAFEFANLGLPMMGLAMVGGYLRLKGEERKRFRGCYGPWALGTGLRSQSLINVFWEEVLERDVGELRRELGIVMPESLREVRRRERDRKRVQKTAEMAAEPDGEHRS